MPDLVFATKGQAAVLLAQEQMKKKADELNAEFKKTAKDAEAAKNAILKIYESTKTPQEQMKQRMEVLRKAIKDGTAPPEAITALERLKAKYQETFGTAQKEITKSNMSLKELDATQKKTFDSSAVTKWGAALGGAVSAAIVASFKTIKDEQKKLADDAKASVIGEGSLAQLADTPEQFQSLLGESRGMYAAGVGRNRNEASDTLFSLINAGVTDRGDRAFFGRMRSAGLVGDAGGFAKAAATIQSTLGGNMQDIVNSGFGAGAFSPGSVEQLLIGASRGGTGAAALGIGRNELIGSTAALAKATGSEMEAGTLIASLLKSLDKAGGFEGKSLAQSLAEITKRVAGGEALRGDSLLGGRQEAVNAYRILVGGGASDFAAATAASGQGAANQVGINKLNIAETADPSLRAARLALTSQQNQDNVLIDEGTYSNLYETQRNELIGQLNQLPWGLRHIGRGLEATRAWTYDLAMPNETLARWRADSPTIPSLDGPTASQEGQREVVKQIRTLEESKAIQAQQMETLSEIARGIGELVARTTDGLFIGGD